MLREAKGLRVENNKRGGGWVYRVWKAKTEYWDFECPNYEQNKIDQMTTPVLVGRTVEKGCLWWCQDRYYWDAECLSQADVVALLVQRQRRNQATLERARAGIVGGSKAFGEVSDAVRRRLLKEEEREREQRHVGSRVVEVKSLNADVDATVSSLEHLLAEALQRDSSVDFELEPRAKPRGENDETNMDVDELRGRFEESAPDAMALYFSHVLDASPYPEGFPKNHRVAFVRESQQRRGVSTASRIDRSTGEGIPVREGA